MEFRKPDRSGGKTCPVFDAYLSVLNGTTGKPKVFASGNSIEGRNLCFNVV